MKRRALPLTALALLAATAALAACAAADGADISLSLALKGGGVTREVGADVFVEATVVNHGNTSAAPFKVDIWASQGNWPRQSLTFPGLAPGADVSVETSVPYRAQWNGLVLFRGEADPAGAVDDSNLSNNSFTLGVQFVSYDTLAVGSRLASSTPLEVGDCLVFEVALRDGESILFQADTREGAARIDQYLLDEANWGHFQDALRTGDAEVTYFADFSTINTNHVQFTTAPLPAGHYYLVLDNAAILQHGALPAVETTVTYSIAKVGNGLPFELVLLILAAGAGAVYFTLRWRPSFGDSEAVLSIPAPELGALSPEDEPDGGDDGDMPDALEGSEEDTGNGDDNGATGAPPRPPRN